VVVEQAGRAVEDEARPLGFEVVAPPRVGRGLEDHGAVGGGVQGSVVVVDLEGAREQAQGGEQAQGRARCEAREISTSEPPLSSLHHYG